MKYLSIKWKLILIITSASIVALVLACTALLTFFRITAQDEMRENAEITADIIGANSVSALVFGDTETAEETLKGLVADPEIVRAYIYTANGDVFTRYPKNDVAQPPQLPAIANYSIFSETHLAVFRAIIYDNETIGTVYLQSDLSMLQDRFWRAIGIVALFTLLATIAALIVGAFLQQWVSKPLLSLAQAARQVSADKDYSIRVEQGGNDEIGILNSSFNDMLGQIQVRDEAVNHELQERQRAEEQMRRSESYYRSLIEHGSDVIVVVDDQQTTTYISPSVQRLFGYQPQALLQTTLASYLHPKDQPIVDQAFQQVHTQPGQLHTAEFRLQHQDQSWRSVQATFNNRLHDPAVQGIVLNLQDLTQQKQAQEQLTQAHKMESIGQLAAGVAHEINTPMQFIGDNTHFLQDGFAAMQQVLGHYDQLLSQVKQGQVERELLDQLEHSIDASDIAYIREKTPEALAESLDGVQRVSQIVQAMRVFAHPGSDQLELADINQLVHSAVTVSRNEWKYVAELELDLDPNLPKVACLPNDLSRVIVNLVVNAAHAIGTMVEEGKLGRIELCTLQQEDTLIITITDTGGGIPTAVQPHVFNPFFTTKEVGKGTGQGLAIAHDVVVNKHHGELSFDSQQGQGTTFFISLPVVDPSLTPQQEMPV